MWHSRKPCGLSIAAGQHDVAVLAGPRFDRIRIGTVEAQFDAGATRLDAGHDAGHRIVEIAVVGMQHEHRAQQFDRREILIGIDGVAPEHVAAETSIAAMSVTSRLTPMPRGSERPKSSAFIHGVFVRFIAKCVALCLASGRS